jgi:ketosteroid isomerase-like protein
MPDTAVRHERKALTGSPHPANAADTPTAREDVRDFVEAYQAAARRFSRGDPEPVKALFSHREDVALANPFGPAVRGWPAVSDALNFASSRFHEGDVEEFQIIALYASDDLVTMLATERWQARVGDRNEVENFALRVTSTLRREDGTWRLVLRHADPITTPDPEGPLRTR